MESGGPAWQPPLIEVAEVAGNVGLPMAAGVICTDGPARVQRCGRVGGPTGSGQLGRSGQSALAAPQFDCQSLAAAAGPSPRTQPPALFRTDLAPGLWSRGEGLAGDAGSRHSGSLAHPLSAPGGGSRWGAWPRRIRRVVQSSPRPKAGHGGHSGKWAPGRSPGYLWVGWLAARQLRGRSGL